ncbi:cytochrome protein [Sarocladium strictum]
MGLRVELVVAALVFLLIYIYTLRSNLSHLPGPWHSRWTRAILTWNQLNGRAPEYVHSLHEKYGRIVRISPYEVDVADIPSVRRIHQIKGEFRKSAFYDFLGVDNLNVFTATDPVFHRQRRRLLSSPISESSLMSMVPIIDARIRQAIERMKEEMLQRHTVDILKWWMFMATDVIGELSFGESFRMLDLGKKNQYIDDLESIGIVTGILTCFPFLFQVSHYIPLPFVKKANLSRQNTARYADESIRRYKLHLAANPSNPKATLFTKLYKAGEEGLRDEEIRNEARAYIIAGSDTTANTLTYLIWSVCRNRDLKKRLVEEVAALPADFSVTTLAQLPMLNNVLSETLRLYSAAQAGLPRVVPPNGVEFGGFWIPGGTVTLTQAYTLHRDGSVFHDPLKFDPSRWEHPTKEMKDAYMPFGGGSRVCIGSHLAKMELRLGIAHFFRAFPSADISIRENMSDEDMKPLQYFLLTPKGHRCLVDVS